MKMRFIFLCFYKKKFRCKNLKSGILREGGGINLCSNTFMLCKNKLICQNIILNKRILLKKKWNCLMKSLKQNLLFTGCFYNGFDYLNDVPLTCIIQLNTNTSNANNIIPSLD